MNICRSVGARALVVLLWASTPSMATEPVTTVPRQLAAQAPGAAAAARGLTGSVAVMPFTNISRDAADDWLADGIAETVIADLGSQGTLTVVGRERVQAALRRAGATAGHEDIQLDDVEVAALGRELNAAWVLLGAYQRLGTQLRITARLVDSRSGVVIRTVKLDGSTDEIFALQDRIARELTADAAITSANAVAEVTGPRRVVAAPAGEGEGLTAVVRSGASVPPGRRDGEEAAAPVGQVTGGIVLPDGDPTADTRRGGSARTAAAPVPTPGGPGGEVATGAGVLEGRPQVTAVRVDVSPQIDGNLDDAVWQRATRITEFVQQSPLEGAAPTEETEVYLAFDDTHLYFGLYAHYEFPSMVRASRVDRDQADRGDDTISIYFDTFLDQQRAYVFTLNGYGVQGDSLVEAGGGGGGGGGGGRGGGGFSGGGGRGGPGGVPRGDSSWDALFESGGTLVDDGWTAELAIPFKSLRYPSVGTQTHRWGFQIARRIRGKDETDVWAPISRDVSGFLPQMGMLGGLSGLSTSRNLEILPTVTAVRVGNLDTTSGGFPAESQPEGGVNVKYGLTSNLTLDATFNPDFSQIESDRPQIDVNQRFPLFFSEQRPFFLEGQEIFSVPGPVNFVHTRTIVDPRYGGKVTGKVGKTTLGVLVANDEAPGKLDDPSDPAFGQTANVLIGRVRYDLYSESHVGAILTDREFADSYSRLAGLDGNFRLSDTASLGFRAITTQNRSVSLVDTSGDMVDVSLRSSGRNLNYFVGGYTIDPEFNTRVGFVRRRDIRAVTSNVGYRWWPENWLINWGPTVSYGRNWDFEDILEDETTRVGVNFSFAKNIRANVSLDRDMERYGGVDFDKTRYTLGGSVNTIQPITLGGSFSYGDEINYIENPFLGKGGSGRLFVTVRPLTRLQSQLNINTSTLRNPFDDTEVFDVKIYRALTTYQFTDRLLLRNIMEYNTFASTVGANVLLTYRVNSGTVFFVGYDDHYQQGDLIEDADDNLAYLGNSRFLTTDLVRTNRAFFTKISYLFRY